MHSVHTGSPLRAANLLPRTAKASSHPQSFQKASIKECTLNQTQGAQHDLSKQYSSNDIGILNMMQGKLLS